MLQESGPAVSKVSGSRYWHERSESEASIQVGIVWHPIYSTISSQVFCVFRQTLYRRGLSYVFSLFCIVSMRT